MRAWLERPTPIALSLSKGIPSSRARSEGAGFDKLSPNGFSLSHAPARFEAVQ
jgi:hypothetical protein